MCNAETAVAVTPLESLLQTIQEFVGVPTLELTATELGEHLVRLRHGIDLLELNFGSAAAAFSATDEYDAQGSVTPIDWIRHHCKMSAHAAARAVSAGEHVHRLRASALALDAGEIGFSHFSLLASVARALGAKPQGADLGIPVPGEAVSDPADDTDPADPSAPVTQLTFDERPLLELAREHSVGRFGHDCTEARHSHDAAAVLEEHVAAAERNRCEFIPCEGGSWPCVATSIPSPRPRSRPPSSPWPSPPGSAITARSPAASPTRWSRSPPMPWTWARSPPAAGPAPISSSPPRWRW